MLTPSSRSRRRRDGAGQPIALAHLRWIPPSDEDLQIYSHDPTVLGKDADLDRLPEGKLRDLLSRSVTTSSNEGGGFTPPYRKEITVETKDLELDIEVK